MIINALERGDIMKKLSTKIGDKQGTDKVEGGVRMIYTKTFTHTDLGKFQVIYNNNLVYFNIHDLEKNLESNLHYKIYQDIHLETFVIHFNGRGKYLNLAGVYQLTYSLPTVSRLVLSNWLSTSFLKDLISWISTLNIAEDKLAKETEQLSLFDIQRAVKYTDLAKNKDITCSVRELSQLLASAGIKTGQNRLFKLLREDKFLDKQNKPYQRYIDQGLFIVKKSVVQKKYMQCMTNTTLVTLKGQQYFLDLYSKEKEEA